MTSNPSNPAKKSIFKPYKEVEFCEFIKFIGTANVPSWSILAEVLEVNRETIARWKRHPLAQAAIIYAIGENLQKMEISGKGDWRMHREMLRMLGVKDRNTVEHYTYDDVKSTIDQLEKENQKTDYSVVACRAKKELNKLAQTIT